MKRLILLTILSTLLLSGCGTKSSSISEENPYEIKVGSETLSIYDDWEKFEENGFEVFEDSSSIAGIMAGCKNNHIVVYNGELTGIFIYSEDIITYKSISVGDDVNKIENTFEYESKSGDEDLGSYAYGVFFNEYGKEISSNDDSSTRAYAIDYWSENNKITEIWIGTENN